MSTTKYVIVSVVSGGDCFEDGFLTDKNAAIEKAISDYHALSDYDKKHLEDYYVGLFKCEEVCGKWFLADDNDPIEVVLSFDYIKNGRGIEYGDGFKFYDLEEAKEYFKREYTEYFDEEDIDNFNEELESVDSFMKLVDCLESWKKTFEDKRVFEVLYI